MQTCKFCGQEVNEEDKFCSFCGAPLNEQTTLKTDDASDNADKIENYSTLENNASENQEITVKKLKFSAFSIAGFVVSLIGILCFAIICGPIGLILSGIGLSETKLKRGKGLAIAGLVVGILDVLAFLMLL